MPRVFTTAREWARLTGRHKLAVLVLLFWAGLTLRVFLSFDPLWIAAQQSNYNTLTIGGLGFAAALFGLTKWADVQMAQIPDAGVPG
jgi:hypothetical protein